ncbi:putative mitochondrial adrenodoxin-like protein,ferredoxin, 2fe-2s-like protein [Leptomonas pyrrhocoris]|uniref:Putative mitochondrial adrenodoxin-like protein,ferredoxin, 2fe-2s-like protein n=1 Tax=Leptomonas pyrrhocoris TaxID=157538 RepID=A0A0M9FRE1_LEPPY|nr:putative mitochondrial adrenodoxin-like protein,ferredoxin, 2fe-2s-like protein [Leptomonas pyrrhocoris]KPA74457.1 putative mitochondrial adrenodoxin-like protein,ferredoxin, 2fe-2s-like protein [Leptomonas pyrrhocoris]|eukprot:XP_015652896.1 putative mitochondrial adrenodoxin-like protein,ferredoxin, 2fe-2s-like protein [Leptomonas pyrrhocoris]
MRPRLLSAACTATAALKIPERLYGTPGRIKVHVKKRDGTHCDVDVPVGISLMQALRDVAKLEVAGTCDGEMECCTYHVYLLASSFAKAGEPSEAEQDLLDKAPDVRETSRLSCCVDLASDLDGIEVELPGNVTDMSCGSADRRPA